MDHGSVTLTRNPYFSQWSFAAQPDGYPDVIAYRLAASDSRLPWLTCSPAALTAPGPLARHRSPSRASRTYLQPFDLLDMQYIFLNRSLPPFDDVRVRQAFSYAIDRRVIAKLASAEVGCQMLPPDFPRLPRYCPHQSGPADGEYQGPDLVRARQLVAESGTAGTEITVHYGLAVPEQEGIARHAASVLAALGYPVDVRPFPDSPMHRLRGVLQLDTDHRAGWVARRLPEAGHLLRLRGQLYRSPSSPAATGNRREGHRGPGGRAHDPMGSLATWAEVDRLLVDDAAMVPTHTLVKKAVVSPSVRNVVVRPGFGPILDQLWVK